MGVKLATGGDVITAEATIDIGDDRCRPMAIAGPTEQQVAAATVSGQRLVLIGAEIEQVVAVVAWGVEETFSHIFSRGGTKSN